MQGTHEPVLKISHLRQGAYTFELIVTDTKGQQSNSEVHVYVKSSQNKPPVASVVSNYTTAVPGAQVVLDGSPSTDDVLITKYQWTQVRYVSSQILSLIFICSRLSLVFYYFLPMTFFCNCGYSCCGFFLPVR